MTQRKKLIDPAWNLRNKAETKCTRTPDRSPDQAGKTLEEINHELRVHQIELEIQNEELKKALLDLEASQDRYIDFYDFAPVGYFALTSEALIIEVNLIGASMLGLVRQDLIHARFRRFVSPKEHDEWDHFFLAALKQGDKQSCELEFKRKDGSAFFARIDSIRVDTGDGSFQFRIVMSDVTERKRAEEKLLNLASIVENSDDAIIGKSLYGIITNWNTGAEKIYGYSASEVIGRSISILIPPDKIDDLDLILQKVRNGVPVSHYETTLIRKDGKSIEVSLTTSPIKDRSGVIVGISTIARDITEQKKVEQAIKHANAYNRSLIEASLDPLVTINPEGRISDMNIATITVTGFSREELIGTDFSQYFTDPDRAKVGYEKVFSEGYVMDYPLELRHRDGQVTPVLYNATVYRDEPGNVIGVFAAARDITRQKQAEEALRISEERLRVTLDAANDGIWDWNIPSGKTFFSPRWYTMLGYEPNEMPSNYATWRSLLHPDDLEPTEQKIRDYMLNEKEAYYVEFRMRTKQGNWLWVLARGKVIERNGNGDPVRMVGTHTDISIRKRIQEELAASYEDLAANERELRQNFEDLTLIERTLRESEERLLMAQEIGQTGSWEYNLQTRRIWGSAEGFRIYGYPPISGDLPIDEIEACIPERERIHQALIDLISEGYEYNLEFTINPVDRSVPKIIQSIARLEKDADGNPLKVVGVIQNVTELKHAELVLKEINEAFVQAQKIAHVGSWMYDLKTNCITWSDELYRVFGREPRSLELNLDTIRMMIHPDDLEKHDTIIKTAIDTTFYRPAEYRVIYPEGSIHHINANGSVETDENGITVRIIGVCQDITDRRRAEEAIQTTVQLNQVIDTMSVNECMNFTLDEAERLTTSRIGFFHFVNPDEQTIQLMTWSSETRKHCFIPKEPERNYPVSTAGVWVDCLRERRSVIHNDYTGLAHKKGLPEGHTPVIRELVVPIFDEDKIVAIIGVGNKATNYDEKDIDVLTLLAKNAWTLIRHKRVEEDLIHSEEKYRSLVENIHVGVYQNKPDEKGSFIWANQAMVAIFGYESFEEFLQIPIVDLYVHPEKRTKYLENLLINGFVKNYEIQMKKKDGKPIWVSVNSHIRYNPDGSIQWIEGFLEDISEHYQIEELKWRAFTQIEKNIEQFSILNDEIRNPLSIILLIISDSEIPDRDIVVEQVTRIDHIIEDLDKGYLESEKVSRYLRKHRQENGS